MKAKTIALVLILAAIAGLAASAERHLPLPRAALDSLDATLRQAASYSAATRHRLDSLKTLYDRSAENSPERWRLLMELSEECRPRLADSSLYYSAEASRLARESLGEREVRRSRIMLVDALSAAGLFSAAILSYDSIRPSDLDHEERVKYWSAGRRLYSNVSNYVGTQSIYYDQYRRKYLEADDSLLSELPDSSLFRSFIMCERLVARGNAVEAREGLMRLIGSLKKGDNLYGMTAYQLALAYRMGGDGTSYASYLAKAAESDVMGVFREGFALPALAAWLYGEGRFTEAFHYINFALEDAYVGGARTRLVAISQWVPEIDEAYRKEISASRKDYIIFIVFVTTLTVALIIMLVAFQREMRRSRAAQRVLAAGSKLKDEYISHFIHLCSAYSEKYDSLVRLVNRKISSGQAQDLLKIVKSGKASDSENEEFYRTIDTVFLNLYPDFVEKLNSLLRPEEEFDVSAFRKSLNPELRIYGFVKLGVTESTKIAQILSYSVNTVYAYRNRMRNRAIDREDFDRQVAEM